MSRLVVRLFVGCAVVAAVVLCSSVVNAQMVDSRKGVSLSLGEFEGVVAEWKAKMIEGRAWEMRHQRRRPLFGGLMWCQNADGSVSWACTWNVPTDRDAAHMAESLFKVVGSLGKGTLFYTQDQWTDQVCLNNLQAAADAQRKQRAGMGGAVPGGVR